MKKTRTIREIIEAAGGAAAIAAKHAAEHDQKLTVDAVYKWRHSGIPDRYWSTIKPMAGADEAELFAANEAARAARSEKAA